MLTDGCANKGTRSLILAYIWKKVISIPLNFSLELIDEPAEQFFEQQNMDTFLDEIAQKNAPVAQMFVGLYKYCSKRNLKVIWTKFCNLLDTDDTKSFDVILEALILDGRTYSAALRFMFDKIAIFKVTTGRLGDYIAQKIASKENDRMGLFRIELNQLMDLKYHFNPMMVNTMMHHCIDKNDVRLHELVSQRVLKSGHSDIHAIDEKFLTKFCNYRSMLLTRRLIKPKI